MRAFFACSLLLVAAGASASPNVPDLDIGYPGLPQSVTSRQLVPGLVFHDVRRGESSAFDHYLLASGVISAARADELQAKLAGLDIAAERAAPAEYGPAGRPLGVNLRIGNFSKRAEASGLQATLAAHGLEFAVRYSAEDGGPTSGPFRIGILTLDPAHFTGEVVAALANGRVEGKQRPSDMAVARDAIAAVNAGYFAWAPHVGTPGDPAGISVIDGELASEAVDGRSALAIDNRDGLQLRVLHDVRSRLGIVAGEHEWRADGLNRKPGLILNCGNPAAGPVTVPAHDFVCTNANEIVVFTPLFGAATPAGAGFEALVDADGKVQSVHERRGRQIPAGGYTIQAIGSAAAEMHATIERGMRIRRTVNVTADGQPLALHTGLYVVNGGPALIRDGHADLAARAREGWQTRFATPGVTDEFVDEKDRATVSDRFSDSRAGFYDGWVVRRHPRTAAGLTADGRFVVVVIYGRQPGISVGASLSDMTRVLLSLGVTQGINLDGGGSSVMVIDGRPGGPVSDPDGERAVGDAILFLN
ncbi:MAG TPA: phosphodiester glycosidase family protein [Vicinamibacterales bacterium]|nr:phosphodiester glycosidase family protein [Vicinamibacterales bacterium]